MKKYTSYRQTFRQHRILFSLPIVLAVIVSAWAVLGSPKSYDSTTSLWVDTSAPADSSLGNVDPALTPPAQQEQTVVTELMATRSFVLSVGHKSLLGSYLATHSTSGFGPSALLSGGGGSLDDRIIAALGGKVMSTVAGPQILQLTYSGPTPAVAASTLGTVVQQLQADSARFVKVHGDSALTYYKAQVQTGSQAVAAARTELSSYLAQHRGAGLGDPTVNALTSAQSAANSQLNQATQNYNDAVSSLHGGSGGSTVSVVDPASTPIGPSSGKKKELMGLLGGLFAGALISLLGVVAMTKRKPTEPWEDEEPAAASSATMPGIAIPRVGIPVAAHTKALLPLVHVTPPPPGNVPVSPPSSPSKRSGPAPRKRSRRSPRKRSTTRA